MAAGQPFVPTYLDRYLDTYLTADALLATYAPGGCWPERPPASFARPAVRWWQRVAGSDTIRQDGFAGRAQSNPEYVICLVDLQNAEQADRIYGSAGMRQYPPQPFLELGAARLYALLHNRRTTVNGFDYYSMVISDYISVEQSSTALGQYEVALGYVVQFRIS